MVHMMLTFVHIFLALKIISTKDLIVEDKQGIEQVLKADCCQKHTSFADNFIFFKLVTRKQTEHEHQHQQLKTFMQTDYLLSRQYHLQSADS